MRACETNFLHEGAARCSRDPNLPRRKRLLRGKVAAAWGLTRLPKIGRQFDAFVIANRIDVVVCTMVSIWDVAVLPVLRRRGLPFVLLVHDASPHPGDDYLFRRMCWRQIIIAADRLLVLSDHVRKELTRLYIIPSARIALISHGAMEFGASGSRRLPRHRPLRLLFLGRILAYKGLDLFLDAYRDLRAQGMPLELEIVGSGDIRPYAGRLNGLDGVKLTNRWVEEFRDRRGLGSDRFDGASLRRGEPVWRRGSGFGGGYAYCRHPGRRPQRTSSPWRNRSHRSLGYSAGHRGRDSKVH